MYFEFTNAGGEREYPKVTCHSSNQGYVWMKKNSSGNYSMLGDTLYLAKGAGAEIVLSYNLFQIKGILIKGSDPYSQNYLTISGKTITIASDAPTHLNGTPIVYSVYMDFNNGTRSVLNIHIT